MIVRVLFLFFATFVLNVAAVNNFYGNKQFKQTAYDQYNLLRFAGGFGPYVDRIGYGIPRETPDKCQVDQVFMLMRHGERFPDNWDGKIRLESLEKLDNYISNNNSLSGDLAFYNTWDNFLKTEKNWWAQESFSGPYGGLSNAYTRGQEFRARYGHLWDGSSAVPIFAAGYERIVNTARKFGEGFFSYNYSDSVYMNIISESAASGANSLVPVCGGDYGKKDNMYNDSTGVMPQMQVAADRLNEQNPGLDLNATDIFRIMGIGPYELNIKSYTPWYDVFTRDEWISYRYGSGDLFYYYRAGPGRKASKPLGSLYVNATLKIMTDLSDESVPLFFNFGHDTDIAKALTALDLYEIDHPLDFNNVEFFNDHTGNMAVMGANLVFERLHCNASSIYDEGKYVRIILNNAVVPIKNCTVGPGYSCPLDDYAAYVNKTIIPFNEKCTVPKGAPEYLDFFWNYNKSTQYNYQQGYIPLMQTKVN